ncbi:MAG: urease accessory protein UreF [Rhodospirillales bacterium]|nr:urease accessory protein UreF [Rhodospirillales bacterium]
MAITGTTMTTEAALYRLMTWLSPAYPLGAFSYSHGLEYAVEAEIVIDGHGLADWTAAVIEYGAGRIDGVLLAAAWRASANDDAAAFDAAATLAAAWRGSAETALENAAQGAAFLAITLAAWPAPSLVALAARHNGRLALPVAVGAAAAAHEVPLPAALAAYLQSFAANLVSAGLRLIPLGQTDGQRAIAALEPAVARAATAALAANLDDLGTACPVVDWCSMRHETQYTRLFRS